MKVIQFAVTLQNKFWLLSVATLNATAWFYSRRTENPIHNQLLFVLIPNAGDIIDVTANWWLLNLNWFVYGRRANGRRVQQTKRSSLLLYFGINKLWQNWNVSNLLLDGDFAGGIRQRQRRLQLQQKQKKWKLKREDESERQRFLYSVRVSF